MKHGNIAVFVPHRGCPHRCSFCDQSAITGKVAMPTPNDVRTVCLQAQRYSQNRRLELAFFGGSFTAIDRQTMVALLDAAAPFCKEGGLSGIRISTRPDAIDPEVLSVLARHKVTAIELGVQSLDDVVLQHNNRGHTAQQSIDAAAGIKAHGFSLGLQMMIGLDNENEDGALKTARGLCEMAPDTVRVYPVLVLKGTLLEKRMREGKYTPLSLEKAVEKTARVLQLFEKAGIRVTRVGLHADKSLEANLVAGPWHPAFRELCESAIMRERISEQLTMACKGKIEVAVHPEDISRMVGHKGETKRQLEKQGWTMRVVPSQTAAPLTPILRSTEAVHCG